MNNVRPVAFVFVLLSASISYWHDGYVCEAFVPVQRVFSAAKSVEKDVSSLMRSFLDNQDTTTITGTNATVVSTTSSLQSEKYEMPEERFQRQASQIEHVQEECILSIHGTLCNLTTWAKAHPGGVKVLQKFRHTQNYRKDATRAFEAAHHSQTAYDMLQQFAIRDYNETNSIVSASSLPTTSPARTSSRNNNNRRRRLWKRKLFTKEDPIGIHKYLGIFVLLNYVGRYYQMYFGDHAAGLGSKGHPWFSFLCLFPHALLSLSSLIFHTVPKERVVGKPMIWQEYRIHNIIFGLRSVITAMAASLAITFHNTPLARRVAVSISCLSVLVCQVGANIVTTRLRPGALESTTATMPYWDGCSITTQRRFKSFYAYSQFMAYYACLAVGNPAWPLCVMLAIQGASFLMTLVRKGLLSTRGYHYCYTATLVAPYLVGFRTIAITKRPDFGIMLLVAYLMYQARRRGVNKYILWVPIVLGRWIVGDRILTDPNIW